MGGAPVITEAWKSTHKINSTTTTWSDGSMRKETEYAGELDGSQVHLKEVVDTNADGEITKSVTDISSVDLQNGIVTEETITNEEGLATYQAKSVFSADHRLVLGYECNPECGQVGFGPAHPTNNDDTIDIVDSLDKFKDKAETISKVITFIFSAGSLRLQCARFAGGKASNIYYKNDRGAPLDIASMVYSCGCQSRQGLNPPFSLGPANRCRV